MKKPAPVIWNPAKSARENAAGVLPTMARKLFSAGRDLASGNKVKLKRLHAFRLQVKQFRYTLELFEPLYGPSLQPRLEKLRLLQQRLGRINDCVTTRDLIEELGDLPKADRVLGHIDRALRRRTQRFFRFWSEEFDAPGEEEAWLRCLRAPVDTGQVAAGKGKKKG